MNKFVDSEQCTKHEIDCAYGYYGQQFIRYCPECIKGTVNEGVIDQWNKIMYERLGSGVNVVFS
jgi:hypothetical protein